MMDTLEVENDGRLPVLRLSRPERKNALIDDLLAAIVDAVRDAADEFLTEAALLQEPGARPFGGWNKARIVSRLGRHTSGHQATTFSLVV